MPLNDDAGFFPCGVYWPWGKRTEANAKSVNLDIWSYTEQLMKILKQYEVNLIWVIHMPLDTLPGFCKLASSVGIKVIASCDISEMLPDSKPDTLNSIAMKITSQWKDLDSLIGYVGLDEPQCWDMLIMNKLARQMKRLDPSRFFSIVVRPHEMSQAINSLEMDTITVDPYCFFFDNIPWYEDIGQAASQERYINRIMTAGRLAARHNKKCWSMPHCFGEINGTFYLDQASGKVIVQPGSMLNFRMTSDQEISWQIWTAIIHNIKGIIPFVLLPPELPREAAKVAGPVSKEEWWTRFVNVSEPTAIDPTLALIDEGLTPSKQFKTVRAIFKELKQHEKMIMQGTPSYPLLYGSENITAATFITPDDEIFAVVVNNNLEQDVCENLSLSSCIAEIDDSYGNNLQITRNCPFNQIQLKLAAGSGMILRLKADPLTHGLINSFDFAAEYAEDMPPGKLVNSHIKSYPESKNINAVVVNKGSTTGVIEFDFSVPQAGRYSPSKYSDSLYLWLEGKGDVEIEHIASDKETIQAKWNRLPELIPDKTMKMKIHLTENTELYSISLIYMNPQI